MENNFAFEFAEYMIYKNDVSFNRPAYPDECTRLQVSLNKVSIRYELDNLTTKNFDV